MSDYIDLNLTADPDVLAQDGRGFLLANAPDGYVIDGWTDLLIGMVARMAVEVVVLTGQVPLSIFRTFGQRVLRITALTATSATGTVTVTAADSLGHTLPAGSTLDLSGQAFATQVALTIPSGSTTGTVGITSLSTGSATSGLSGAATLQSAGDTDPTWVDALTVPSMTSGGLDGETDSDYVDRLADEIPTLSPKAITLRDFETIARADLEVQRALAINLYVPASGGNPAQTNVPGAVTVAVVNAAGQPVSTGGKTRVQQTLADGRVLNLVVSVIDPTYTSIDVRFSVQPVTGVPQVTANAEAAAAIADALSPARFAVPDGDTSGELWDSGENLVRRNDLLVAARTPNVRHVLNLTLARTGQTQGTADVTLDGPAPLPQPGTIAPL